MPDESNSVPATEAAMQLGISRERTVRLIQCGVLRGRRKNGSWLADPCSVDEYLGALRTARQSRGAPGVTPRRKGSREHGLAASD